MYKKKEIETRENVKIRKGESVTGCKVWNLEFILRVAGYKVGNLYNRLGSQKPEAGSQKPAASNESWTLKRK